MRTTVAALGVLFAAVSALGNTYTVTNTADSGAGSLRQAILDANANPGADTIAFAVSGAGCDGNGVCTITPLTALHSITSPVTIDGYTQTGAAPNTNASGAINAVLKVVVSGVNDPNAGDDIAFLFMTGSDGSTVRGLVINGWSTDIYVNVANVAVTGCFIGTDAAGTTAVGFSGVGVYAFGGTGASALTVGGPQPADRNLIAGVGGGVSLDGVLGATVEGNLLGTNATGAATLPPANPLSLGTYAHISLPSVGGTTFIRGNVIAASWGASVIIGSSSPSAFETILQGNFVGTDVTGTVDLGNTQTGIEADTTDVTVGGTGAGEGNVIAFNAVGVAVTPGTVRCKIRGNSIYSNGPLAAYGAAGIAIFNPSPPLSYTSPLPNDFQDTDGGSNQRQNFPIIASAISSGGSTTITGSLNSTPNTLFDVDFYSNPGCVTWPRSYFEGKTYLGSGQVTTDGNGDAAINVVLPVTLAAGEVVTSTATDPDGNTSEFSQRIVLHSAPGAGDPAGVVGAQLDGFNFLPGATVTVGGVPAPSVVVNDYYTATFTTPSLSPGTVNAITLTNTDGTSGTLPSGWVADFLDVRDGQNPFWDYVSALVRNGITAGVGGGLYGVNDSVKRQQMAVFLLKGKHGVCYTPPPCQGTFNDVPCPSTFANWIEALAAEGITGGCGGGGYCPQNPVRRDQMAVFLLKAEHGSTYVPPACTGVFPDVPCPGPFTNWIERLAYENITGGCGNGLYCPASPNTRGQMAVFLSITFNLQ